MWKWLLWLELKAVWSCWEPQPQDGHLLSALGCGTWQGSGTKTASERACFCAGVTPYLWDAQNWFGVGAGAPVPGECSKPFARFSWQKKKKSRLRWMGLEARQQWRDGNEIILWLSSQVLDPMQIPLIRCRLALSHLHCLQWPVSPQKPVGHPEPPLGSALGFWCNCSTFVGLDLWLREVWFSLSSGTGMLSSTILLGFRPGSSWVPVGLAVTARCFLSVWSQETDLRSVTLICLVRT